MAEGARELSGVSFERALTSFMKVPPSSPNCLPRAAAPNTITLGTRISMYEFERDTNIQSILAGVVKWYFLPPVGTVFSKRGMRVRVLTGNR